MTHPAQRGLRILVTVGTTDFDALVRKVDQLAPAAGWQGWMQIGEGVYEPRNLPFFRIVPSLASYFERVSLVIAHGGYATTMEVLRRGLPLVSCSNPDRYDGHQQDLLSALSERGELEWCRHVDDLPDAVDAALSRSHVSMAAPECHIEQVIHRFLRGEGP